MTTEAQAGADLFTQLQPEASDAYWSAFLDYTPAFLQWYMWTNVAADAGSIAGPPTPVAPSPSVPLHAAMALEMYNLRRSRAVFDYQKYFYSRSPPNLQDDLQPLVDDSLLVPITVTDLAAAQNYSAGGAATLAIPGITAAVGTRLIIFVASDNSGTAGVSPISATISGGGANVITRVSNLTRSVGNVINDGVSLSVFDCPVTVALNNATLTANFSPVAPGRTALVKRLSCVAGQTMSVAAGAGVTAAASAYTSGVQSVNAKQSFIPAVAAKNNVVAGGDVDALGGTWSAIQSALADSGVQTTSNCLQSQWKTPTISSATQAYNGSFIASRHYTIGWVIATTQRV